MRSTLPIVIVSVLVVGAAAAKTPSDPKTGGIVLEQAWVRPAPAGVGASVAYGVIRNTGRKPDALVSVATPAARTAGVHVSVSHAGVMSMEPIASLPLPPGAAVALKPGGLHVMLEGVTRPLKAGETVALTFRFKTAAPLTVRVPVRPTAP
jgi:copper(I)-binding protein